MKEEEKFPLTMRSPYKAHWFPSKLPSQKMINENDSFSFEMNFIRPQNRKSLHQRNRSQNLKHRRSTAEIRSDGYERFLEYLEEKKAFEAAIVGNMEKSLT